MNRRLVLVLVTSGCIENQFGSKPDFDELTDSGTSPPTTPTTPTTPPVGFCDDTLSVDLTFPERIDCPWGIDDNLTELDTFNRARVDEVQNLILPDGATLCDLAVHSTSEDLLFDDHVTIALDDVALVGGGYGYDIDILPVVGNLRRYSWATVVDQEFGDRDAPYWCLGEPESVCVLPVTEIAGPLDLELSDDATRDLVAAMAGRTELPFVLTTFGDNDDDDCAHTTLTLRVDVSYTLP